MIYDGDSNQYNQVTSSPGARAEGADVRALAGTCDRLGVVLGNAPAIIVHVAELEVGSCLPLPGGPPMPLRRLGLVLRDAQAIGVHKAEGVLSSWVALLSQRTPLIQGRCIVIAIIGFQTSLGVRRQHRRG